jgi:PII-like signaling protein
MAGATVVKGIMSYGEESRKGSYRFFSLLQVKPVMIVIVDNEEKIFHFAEILKKDVAKSK